MTEASQTEDRQTRAKRLRYRSWHRGTRELDLLLGPFADRHLAALSAAELALYESLLETPEPLLYDLLTGKATPPPHHDNDVLRQIRTFLERPRIA